MSSPSRRSRPSRAALEAMIEEATVGAYGEEEQASAWACTLEEQVELPFITRVLGVEVSVERIELRNDSSIVALCARGRERQAIPIIDLPLPRPPPAGAEWIAAYKHFCRG